MLEFSENLGASQTKKGEQIVARSSTLDAVMYVVPEGRTFTGHVMAHTSATVVKINEVSLTITAGTTSFSAIPIPLTLLAGTIVKCGGSSAVSLIGVEE